MVRFETDHFLQQAPGDTFFEHNPGGRWARKIGRSRREQDDDDGGADDGSLIVRLHTKATASAATDRQRPPCANKSPLLSSLLFPSSSSFPTARFHSTGCSAHTIQRYSSSHLKGFKGEYLGNSLGWWAATVQRGVNLFELFVKHQPGVAGCGWLQPGRNFLST